MPAAEFFASLVSDSDFSIVVHPDVRGTVSLQLKQVTLPEVMAVVQQIYGFDVRQQGLIYQVYPAGLRTETIAVNYLLMQAQWSVVDRGKFRRRVAGPAKQRSKRQ